MLSPTYAGLNGAVQRLVSLAPSATARSPSQCARWAAKRHAELTRKGVKQRPTSPPRRVRGRPNSSAPRHRSLLPARHVASLAPTAASGLGGVEGAVRPPAQGASLGAARSWKGHSRIWGRIRSPIAATIRPDPADRHVVSPRGREVLALVAQGSEEADSEELDISESREGASDERVRWDRCHRSRAGSAVGSGSYAQVLMDPFAASLW